MRILVDGYNFAQPAGTGVATYGRNFSTAVQALGHEVSVIFGAECAAPELIKRGEQALLHKNARLLSLPQRLGRISGGARSLFRFEAKRIAALDFPVSKDNFLPDPASIWNSYGLFAYAIGGHRKLGTFSTVRVPGIDIAHWTYPLPLRAEGAINIYTIHDLIPVLQPELTLDKGGRYRRLCAAVSKRADLILTVSESSRKDIVETLGVSPERVINTYQPHSIDALLGATVRAETPATIAREFGLQPDGYFLFFGAIEPKKNVGRLLESYFLSGSTTPLILAGGNGWLTDHELAPLHARMDSEAGKRVSLYGFLPRSLLLALVCGARATFFPSLNEGFGLPVLEAMALGTPVMASMSGGLGEVIGDAALIVDPLDIEMMAAAINRLDREPALREYLTIAGLRRADVFSMATYMTRLDHIFAAMKEKRNGEKK